MEIFDVVVRIGLVGLTTILFVIVLLAYSRMRSRKMLLITIGFGIMSFHAFLTVPEIFSESYHTIFDENVHLLAHMIGLIFILLGTLKD